MSKKPIALVNQDDPSKVIAYACGECGAVVGVNKLTEEQAKGLAANHCGPWTCEKCGTEHDRSYQPTCRVCFDRVNNERRAKQEAARFDKAEKITAHDGPVYSEEFDQFFADVDDMLDWCACEQVMPPDYVWPCSVSYPSLMMDDVCDMALREHMDSNVEGELEAQKELADFLDEWNAKQTSELWEPRYGQVVVAEEGKSK